MGLRNPTLAHHPPPQYLFTHSPNINHHPPLLLHRRQSRKRSPQHRRNHNHDTRMVRPSRRLDIHGRRLPGWENGEGSLGVVVQFGGAGYPEGVSGGGF